MESQLSQPENGKKKGFHFILLMGIVSLFADMTYEGARSIIGPYLAILGATGTTVGVVAGLGEFVGYAIRLVSGYVTDKTAKYWTITFFGFFINLFAIPLLAFTSHWQTASLLIIAERFGKAIRNPARDTMLSFATKEIGRGRGFGLHAALDKTGAILGPLMIFAILLVRTDYRMGFALLAIPAVVSLLFLYRAKLLYPHPAKFEAPESTNLKKGFTLQFWVYLTAVSLVAAGYVDFALIAYHFQKSSTIASIWIPVLYAMAMTASALSSLLLGPLYDVKGTSILMYTTGICAFFAPCVLLGNFFIVLLGMLLWGLGLGSQATIMRAVIAQLVPVTQRGTAYGILNVCFGLFWFFGSAAMGFLYDISLSYLILFSVGTQLAAIPFFFFFSR